MPAQSIPAPGPSVALSTGSRTSGRASCFRVFARLGQHLVAPIVAAIDSVEAGDRLREIWPEAVVDHADQLHVANSHIGGAHVGTIELDDEGRVKRAWGERKAHKAGDVLTAAEASDPLRRIPVPSL